MAKTEVFTCDICKQSKSRDDLAKITVRSEGIRMRNVGYNGIQIDICPECLKRKGFVVEPRENENDDENVKAQNAATLEDKIYDILSDMGVLFEE